MPKFSVRIELVQTRSGWVDVKAANQAAADKKAIALANNHRNLLHESDEVITVDKSFRCLDCAVLCSNSHHGACCIIPQSSHCIHPSVGFVFDRHKP